LAGDALDLICSQQGEIIMGRYITRHPHDTVVDTLRYTQTTE